MIKRNIFSFLKNYYNNLNTDVDLTFLCLEIYKYNNIERVNKIVNVCFVFFAIRKESPKL